jgi:DNA repair protein RadC
MFTLRMSIGKSKEPIGRTAIHGPEQVYHLCKELADLNQETFAVLCLNAKNKVISKNIITIGIVNQTLVHPREIFRVAIQDGAHSIILIHNHPSGEITPSSEDVLLTKKILECSKFLCIPVRDHVIIGKSQDDYEKPYKSLRESGLCTFDQYEETLRAAE